MNIRNNHNHLKTKPSFAPAPMSLRMFSATVNEGVFSMEEIWKPVVGYEGLYEVSSFGNIKAVPKQVYHARSNKIITRKERRMGSFDNGRGYHQVVLTKDGETRYTMAHRVVAQAFIPNIENKREVNHKNGIKTDNRVENLEWATRSENLKHAFRTGLMGMNRRRNKKLNTQQLSVILHAISFGATQADLCRVFGMSQSAMSVLCRDKKTYAL